MNLSNDKTEVWCHVCLEWHIIKEQLWFYNEEFDRFDIICIKQYPEKHILLGFDYDL